MKCFKAKKCSMVGSWCGLEMGSDRMINNISDTLDCMGFGFEVIKLHVYLV